MASAGFAGPDFSADDASSAAVTLNINLKIYEIFKNVHARKN